MTTSNINYWKSAGSALNGVSNSDHIISIMLLHKQTNHHEKLMIINYKHIMRHSKYLIKKNEEKTETYLLLLSSTNQYLRMTTTVRNVIMRDISIAFNKIHSYEWKFPDNNI